jgi:hypothetical protein
MDGQNYVVFHNAADDSYMNTSANFRGCYATAEAVDIYFESAISSAGNPSAYDKITLACTNGEEDRAVEQVASAMGGAKAGGFTVVADDVNSVYAGQDLLSVSTISLASSGRTHKLISWTEAKTLTAGDSGAWIYANDATAGVLTLPSVSAGLTYEIFIQKAQTGDTHILAQSGEFFEGALLMSDADTTTENMALWIANTAEDDAINLDSDAKGRLAGGYIKLVSDGTKWHATGILNGTGSIATPWHTAES